jgi:hypothetical protein
MALFFAFVFHDYREWLFSAYLYFGFLGIVNAPRAHSLSMLISGLLCRCPLFYAINQPVHGSV